MECKLFVGKNLSFNLAGETCIDVFRQMAVIQSTFQDTACGACKSEDIICTKRDAKDDDGEVHEYLEMRCNACGSKLAYGKSKDLKNIYPKRMKTGKKGKVERDANDKAIYLPNNGWVKFVADSEGE